MYRLWLLVPCLIVLAFCAVVYVAGLSWRKMTAGKRIAGGLLLAPHFLLIVSIAVGLLCGQAAQGSRCFNAQFFSGVLMLFILPVPALAGTLAALIIFLHARSGP